MKKHLLITICLAVFCALATQASAPKYVDVDTATGSLTETPPQQKAFVRSADVSETSASVSYTFNHVRLVPDGEEGEYAVTVPGFGRFSDPAGWSLPASIHGVCAVVLEENGVTSETRKIMVK